MNIDISIEAESWQQIADILSLCEVAIEAAAQASHITILEQAEVSLLLTDDTAVRELNREWRGQDKPTNVLSFPGSEPDQISSAVLLGDIVMAFETIQKEALANQTPLQNHIKHLVVHGFLHLLGFDHETEEDAQTMEQLETRILAGLSVPDPYSDEHTELA